MYEVGMQPEQPGMQANMMRLAASIMRLAANVEGMYIMHLLKKRSLVFYLGFVLVLTMAIGGAAIGAFAAGPTGNQSITLSNTGTLAVSGAFGTVDGTGALDGTDHAVPYTLKVDVANPGVSLTGWKVSISGTDMIGTANSANKLIENFASVLSSDCDSTDSDCTPAVGTAASTFAITSASTPYFTANTSTGLGTIDVQTKINVNVLAATAADTYTATLTLDIAATP
jgi:hypothetical protein